MTTSVYSSWNHIELAPHFECLDINDVGVAELNALDISELDWIIDKQLDVGVQSFLNIENYLLLEK